ncbi:MAG: hypothetical protein LC808_43015 [Actinobacteria bacterium]|nr:hypothetical protein [Actinomycetota bacterium]
MIREDRELFAELARLNTAMASLALRIMDGSASVAEQHNYAQRLIVAGERLQQRANEMNHPVIEGEVPAEVSVALPAHTTEPHGESLDASNATSVSAPAGRGSRLVSAPFVYRTALARGGS